ncbi:kinase-like domain-containing protein [Rhexocercosporidium sp. MPI-PUGE-AT-0058]|nr:kinase-like domain-containing protein [Rhexocercosporidium sp. MPI-PUGE-AT-0058]
MASEKKFGEDYNMWAQYNDPNYIPQTVTQIRKTYRRTPYTPPLNTAPPPILPFLRPFPLPVIRPDYKPPNPEDQKLLSATPPSLPPPLANWKGVKVLGSGTSGAVVLFQHISHGTPQAPLNVLSDGTATMPFPTQIAVKTIEKPSFSVGIDREARLLKTLNESGSSHVVRLLGVPLVADLKREGLTAGWKGRSRRLILEYCSEGTLDGLIERRKARGVHYQRYGRELMFDAVFKAAREQFLPNPKFKDELVVHHDFKPENIFASGRDNTHEYTPVFKIGDFGLSQPWPTDPALQVPKHTEPDNQYYRQLGTPGYYAPEQFTPRWIFSDYKTSPVAGIYGSHTNVWGIGCCMYELLTLIIKTDDEICTPEPHIPFLPSTPLHGNAPRGLAFGTRLQGAREYSTELRDTVQECLYEGPRKRPRLVELKGRVFNMIRGLVERQGPGGEEWEDLSMPEPLTEYEVLHFSLLFPIFTMTILSG